MSEALNRDVTYLFRLKNNVTEVVDDITTSTKEAVAVTNELTKEQNEAEMATDRANDALTRQEFQVVKSLTVMNTFKLGINNVVGGLTTLGVLNTESSKGLKTLVSSFQLLSGSIGIFKALTMASNMFNLSQKKLAITEVFRSVMNSPWKAAAAVTALGVAGAAGLYLMGGGNTTNNTIVVENSPEHIQTATGMYAMIGGGSL